MIKHEPLEALARAFDKEDASQRGEPDPWKDAEDDAEWVSERLACAQVAEAAYLAARSVPEAGKRWTTAQDIIASTYIDGWNETYRQIARACHPHPS